VVFESHGIDRLTEWKQFRHTIEKDSEPFPKVVNFWLKAPFVNQYLDYRDPSSWPDPWHLVLDSRYDNLAIVLGMLYTLLLTDRFSKENYKIYMIKNEGRQEDFCLAVGNTSVLNLIYGQISHISELHKYQTNMIYEINHQQ
jgi:hypothetical protein